MSDKRTHFIPHPLCSEDLKVMKDEWDKQGIESLTDYVKNSPNPRWCASFLVRAVSKGLSDSDPQASTALAEVANQLASRQ